MLEIPIDSIRVSPFQPRRTFSEEELAELGASIQAVGLIHPPAVRAVKNQERVLYYELISGERRWRACKKIGLSTIKVMELNLEDETAAKATLIENVQRVDLDPIEVALAFKKLIEVFRMTQEELAERVGKKRSTVANYLRLLTLPANLQKSLSKGDITMGHAKAILSLESDQLQSMLHTLIVDKQLTVRAAEKESRKLSTKPQKDPHISDMERSFCEELGTKVEVHHRKDGSGTISIHYYNLDDLDQLTTKLAPQHQA